MQDRINPKVCVRTGVRHIYKWGPGREEVTHPARLHKTSLFISLMQLFHVSTPQPHYCLSELPYPSLALLFIRARTECINLSPRVIQEALRSCWVTRLVPPWVMTGGHHRRSTGGHHRRSTGGHHRRRTRGHHRRSTGVHSRRDSSVSQLASAPVHHWQC